MAFTHRQLAGAGALVAAGFLGFGAMTAASAQDSDDSTSTTVEEDAPSTSENDRHAGDHDRQDRENCHDREEVEQEGS